MGRTLATLSEKSVWVVEAECAGDKATWTFDEREVAEWCRDKAQAYYMARCPSCGAKDALNMGVNRGTLVEVIVSCAYPECDFAKRIVRM